MPEHVHLLVSDPGYGRLADAIHYLKLSIAKRLRSGVFWEGAPFKPAFGLSGVL
jgi:hypothetical protein